jgi:hypothetical protein
MPLGLQPLSPGFARLRGTPAALLAFADAHPEFPLEVAPRPHLLLNKVAQTTRAEYARQRYGVTGKGVLIGVADTGADFTLRDFDDPATGDTRIVWLIDFTAPFAGLYPDLEQQFGDTSTIPPMGAVYAGRDLQQIVGGGGTALESGELEDGILTDNVGHGTHVTSIAAGNGGGGPYVGIAPDAGIIVARITSDTGSDLSTDYLLAGVAFLYNRADELKMPIAVNLSIGSDFGSHDGLMAWEQSLAAFVGPDNPGRALLVAAGNSGDITSDGVHTSVYVPPGGTRSISIRTLYGGTYCGLGQAQVWVTMRGGAKMSVGLDSPAGTWIEPIGPNASGSYPNHDAGTCTSPCGPCPASAEVLNGSSTSMGQIPEGSDSAIVLWGQGDWDAGTYAITLTGEGTADLYIEGSGDAVDDNGNGVAFMNPVREGTVNIPATSPGLIAVGCTVNRSSWTSVDNGLVSVGIAPLDGRGGYALADTSTYAAPIPGDVCWFSSAGPTVTGVQKPEVSAPGGLVIAAMSGQARGCP